MKKLLRIHVKVASATDESPLPLAGEGLREKETGMTSMIGGARKNHHRWQLFCARNWSSTLLEIGIK
jgi:hypothetical protein